MYHWVGSGTFWYLCVFLDDQKLWDYLQCKDCRNSLFFRSVRDYIKAKFLKKYPWKLQKIYEFIRLFKFILNHLHGCWLMFQLKSFSFVLVVRFLLISCDIFYLLKILIYFSQFQGYWRVCLSVTYVKALRHFRLSSGNFFLQPLIYSACFHSNLLVEILILPL